ncbi:MAG: hypothetical protein F4W90_05690 [Gammaproteobacteria bacterium]|nr:hypothetical protein [Gammaproteobacteria bacterium]
MTNSLETAIKRTVEDEGDPPRSHNLAKRSVMMGGRFDSRVSRELAIIAAEEGSTKQRLLEEAIDLLLAKRARPSIADLENL